MSGLIHAGANDAWELVDHPGPMVLIEPLELAYGRLVHNFASRSDVTLVKTALGSSRGTAVMQVASSDYSSSLLEPLVHLQLYPRITFPGREAVPVDTLDNVMADIDGEYDELILDAQGFELEILKGATETLGRLKRIVCEVAVVELYKGAPMADDIDAYLEGFGFKCTLRNLHETESSAWGDSHYERA